MQNACSTTVLSSASAPQGPIGAQQGAVPCSAACTASRGRPVRSAPDFGDAPPRRVRLSRQGQPVAVALIAPVRCVIRMSEQLAPVDDFVRKSSDRFLLSGGEEIVDSNPATPT